MQHLKRALVIALDWSPVTATAEPPTCSSAAVTSTTEPFWVADIVLWVALGGVYHFVERQLFLCNQVTGLALTFYFWSPSSHPFSSKAFPSVAERSDGRNGERLL